MNILFNDKEIENSKKYSKFEKILSFCAWGYVALVFICSFFPRDWNWGFSLLAFFPIGIRIIWLVLASLVLISKTRKIVFKQFKILLSRIQLFSPYIRVLLFVIVLCAICWMFPVRFYQLGDGSGTLTALQKTAAEIKETGTQDISSVISTVQSNNWYIRQPFVGYLHSYLFAVLNIPQTGDVQLMFRMIGIFIFLCTVLLLHFFFRKLDWSLSEKILLGSILVFSGCSVFFFGYIESYTVFYFAILLYLVSGWLAAEGKMHFVIAGLSFIVMVGFHFASIFFLPSFVFLFVIVFLKRKTEAFVSLGIMVSILLISFLISGKSFQDIFQVFNQQEHSSLLPFFTNKENYFPYTIFSFPHFIDIVNEHLLVIPFIGIIVVLFFVVFWKMVEWKNHLLFFLLITSASGFLFTFVGNFELGYARDWDVVSVFLLPLVFLAIYLLHEQFEKMDEIVFALAVLSFLQNVLWISVNVNERKGVQRFYTLESTTQMNNRIRGYYYDQWAQYYIRKKLDDSSVVYLEKAVRLLPNNSRAVLKIKFFHRYDVFVVGNNIISADNENLQPKNYFC
jgi:hypothetical protein